MRQTWCSRHPRVETDAANLGVAQRSHSHTSTHTLQKYGDVPSVLSTECDKKKTDPLKPNRSVSSGYLQTVTLTPSLLSPLLSFSLIHSILLSTSLSEKTPNARQKVAWRQILILGVRYRRERKKKSEIKTDGRGRQREEHSESVSWSMCGEDM